MDAVETVVVPDPAPAANFVYTADDDILIIGFSLQLATSATVANRRLKWTLEDENTKICQRESTTADVAASFTALLSAAAGRASGSMSNNWVPVPLPATGLPMKAGWKLKSVVDFLSAGDQLSNIVILFQRTGKRVS